LARATPHDVHAGRAAVHLRGQVAERAAGDQHGALRAGLQIGKRFLDGGHQPHDGDVEYAAHHRRVDGQQIARLAAAGGVPVDDDDRAERRARLADGGAHGGGVARVGREGGGGDPLRLQGLDALGEPVRISRDERDGEAGRAEPLGDGGGDARPKSHDEDGLRHCPSNAAPATW
jgi:hypothetical protein